MSDEFTPTLEEFVYSFVPTQWFNPTLENLWYWNIKTSMVIGGIAIRTAILYPYVTAANVALHGSRLAAAGYAATESFSVYSILSKARNIGIVLTTPPLLIGTAAVAAQVHTLSSPPPSEYQGSGEAGWWRAVAQALTGGIGVGTAVNL